MKKKKTFANKLDEFVNKNILRAAEFSFTNHLFSVNTWHNIKFQGVVLPSSDTLWNVTT